MNNRIKTLDKNFKEIFKSTPADLNTGDDPEMMVYLQRYIFGETFEIGNLTNKERERITCVVLACLQTLPQLSAHTNGALNTGNTPLEVRESIYTLAPILGIPRTLNALNAINETFKQRGIALPLENVSSVNEKTRMSKGKEIQEDIYGDEIRKKYQDLPDNMGEQLADLLTGNFFGDIYTRDVLTIQEQELITLVALATLNMTNQLKAHTLGNLKVGNSKEKIYATLIQALPYIGFPAAFNAINVVKEI